MTKPIYVINGPNLNRLGKREPEIYGTTTLAEIEAMCREAAGDTPVRFHQSNCEGEIIDWIHEAIDEGAGIVINPAGFSLHLDRDPRRAEDVSRPDHRAAHLEHPPARGHLPRFARVEGRDRGDRRARAARLCRRGSRDRATCLRQASRGAEALKTSIATVSISGDLREKLAAIAAAGFDGVEIFENDFLAFDGSPAEVGRMVRDHGLEITLFQPFRDFEGMPEPQRSRAFDRAERKFDLMGELGTDLMLVCSNVSPLSLGGIDRAADDFRELGELAAKRGLRVGYEALAWGRHINDHRDAWEIVRRADHPNIGLILDSFHTLARRVDVETIRAIPGDRIFIVQLADAPLIDMDLLYWSRHFRNMPGEGDLPVVDFMRAVAATGYDGPLSLEIFNDQFRGGSPRSIAVDGHRSLVYLMDQVARAEPGIAIDVPAMPERVAVSGVEFVEFAANETEAEELTATAAHHGLLARRPSPEQGCDAVSPGRHQHRRQHREGRAGALLLPRSRHLGLCLRIEGR